MATNKETIRDLQTCKTIDSAVEKNNNEDIRVMLSIKLWQPNLV